MEDKNSKIQFSGKVAKFPKNTKAVKALQYLENIKVNPNKLWYVLVETDNNGLKIVKYNRQSGINLVAYTEQLKQNYLLKYAGQDEIITALNEMCVVGEEQFSVIKNIPNIMVAENISLTSKITSDLINLLAD